MRVIAVVPALNEAATIGAVVAALRAQGVDEVVVVDGGSDDDTRARAEAAGAQTLLQRQRGYGRACMSGATRALACGADVLLFAGAAGAEEAGDVPKLLAPLRADRADLVLGARRALEPGALRPLQRLGNRLATAILALRTGHRYRDLGSMRALHRAAFERLDLREMAHGWPIEMQLKALQRGLRVVEVEVGYRRRRAGRSKVSGSLVGSARAGVAIVRVACGLGGGGR